METIIVKTVQFLLSLSILVLLHEFGHFIFARIFKARVDKFYLFFNPWFTLFKFKKGETEYGIGWLPLGGYCKISGMIDESLDKEQLAQPPQPYELRSKPAWQRLFVMLGGVLMNFIFAILIYVGISYAWGESFLPTANAKYGIYVTEVGEQIGFRNGDKILTVDGQYVENFNKILLTIVLNNAKTVQVERNGQHVNIELSNENIALLLKSKGVFEPRIPFKFGVKSLKENSVGEKAGLQIGDEILGLNGNFYIYHDEWSNELKSLAGKEIVLNVERNGQPLDIQMTLGDDGVIGIINNHYDDEIFEYKTINYGFFQSFPAGIKRGIQTTGDYLKQFKLIFNKETKAYKSLGGFAAIGNIFPATWDWFSFWNMTAFLSIILAIMNLLPIPALDGGHVLFLIFEMITGKKPGDKFLEYAQIVGMALLLALVLYANANDIIKIINGTF